MAKNLNEAIKATRQLSTQINEENRAALNEVQAFFDLFKDEKTIKLLQRLVPEGQFSKEFPLFSRVRTDLVPGMELTETMVVEVGEDLVEAYLKGLVVLEGESYDKIDPELLFDDPVTNFRFKDQILGEFTDHRNAINMPAWQKMTSMADIESRVPITRDNVKDLFYRVDLYTFRRYQSDKDFLASFTREDVILMVESLNSLLEQARLAWGTGRK